jgi:hypothetical protein
MNARLLGRAGHVEGPRVRRAVPLPARVTTAASHARHGTVTAVA